MSRIVQKFGGTSVKDPDHIRRVAEIVAKTYKQNKEVVVVVSAMGQSTDELIELALQADPNPEPRELDVLLATGEQVSIAMLAIALRSMGLKARSFTGPQAGILTDDAHGFARIKTVHPTRLESSLRKGEIPVVAGFQGMNRNSELTTLGRGGSDTTAVALAAALKAECCDIYTDVEGVYTTDPRTVQSARKLGVVSYQEMLALASAGAQVLNARSVELAMNNSVPIRLRSTFLPDNAGTLVTTKDIAPVQTVCGVACDASRVWVRVAFSQSFNADQSVGEFADNFSKQEDAVQQLLSALISLGIDKETVCLTRSNGINVSWLEFHCEKRLLREVQSLLTISTSNLPDLEFRIDSDLALVSLIGLGIDSDYRISDNLAKVIRKNTIPVLMQTHQELRSSVLIPGAFKEEAVRLVHDEFCSRSVEAESKLAKMELEAEERALRNVSTANTNNALMFVAELGVSTADALESKEASYQTETEAIR
ncbi:MAG: aspartate kinase [Candidatus Obscuribacterales bacterium]|nr:aspartate kinase [Candidatus Obscuribacterales bacterium]